ncbi:MAG: hypothetical protein IJI44_04340 [Erysipelotrichaceae bacterium]|nr:hypothetical protein [Erysipelotrichaceae bacterium]
MLRIKYSTPVLFELDDETGSGGTVIGQGTGQGTNFAEGMDFDTWWEEIAWGGDNPDADYNGDGTVDVNDYDYYIENRLWEG